MSHSVAVEGKQSPRSVVYSESCGLKQKEVSLLEHVLEYSVKFCQYGEMDEAVSGVRVGVGVGLGVECSPGEDFCNPLPAL